MLSQHRHCERSDLSAEALAEAEAIQSLSAEGFWIASSQGLLAMTEYEVTALLLRSHFESQTRLRSLAA
jgi:hypothetical protein